MTRAIRVLGLILRHLCEPCHSKQPPAITDMIGPEPLMLAALQNPVLAGRCCSNYLHTVSLG